MDRWHAASGTALVCMTASLGLAPAPGQAQTPAGALPDAGSLRQQLEPRPKPALPARGPAVDAGAVPGWVLPDGERITVRQFRFEGQRLLSDAVLARAVQPFLNRDIGFAELRQATQAVAQAYRDAGWVARAFLPRQDITEGTVTIGVVEAVFGGVRWEGPAPVRLSAQRLTDTVLAQQAVGQPLSARALDTALLLADDLPGVTVSGALAPGLRDGETVLALRATDEPAWAGELQLDNTGARSTGAVRLMAHAKRNSPGQRGDQLRIQSQLSEGSRYARLAWDTPLGHAGARVGLQASHLSYRLVDPALAGLDGRGSSTGLGLDASRPLLRTRQQNLYLSLAADVRRYANQAHGSTRSRYQTHSVSITLNGNRHDDGLGGGVSSASLGLQWGQLNLGTLDAGEDTARSGRHVKLRIGLLRRQTLAPQWTLVGQLRGQYAGRRLDSSERFYLGGADGVRAYPSAEGGGSQGHVASLDLHRTLGHGLTATAFADIGQATDPGVPSTALSGVGAALSWQSPQGITASLSLARRLGDNPQALPNGRDSDGSLLRHRVWAQIGMPF